MIQLLVAACLLAQAPQPLFEAPFRVSEEAMVVDATLNGASVSLMFDSGFSGVALLNEGITLGKPSGKQRLRDFVGEFDASTYTLDSLKLAGHALPCEGERIVQQPLRGLSSTYNTHIDGLLGFGAFKNSVMEINFERKVLRVFPKSYDISNVAIDGKQTFLSKLLPIGHSALVMSVQAGEGKNFVMSLDTGNAFYATTHRDVLERLGLWSPDRQPKYVHPSGVASGQVDTWDIVLKGVTIFGVPVAECVWDVIEQPASSAESDGTVGFLFLRNFNVTIDYGRRVVLFQNFSGTPSPPPVGDIGLLAGYSRSQKRSVVLFVTPGGPAAQAGIKAGDELLSINGREIASQSLRQMRALTLGPIGSKVRVDVSASGNYKRLELKRQLLANPAVP